LQLHKLAKPCAGFERRSYKLAEIGIAGVDEALRFGDREIARPRYVHTPERCHTSPGRIRGHLAVPPSPIQRGFQDRQLPIRGRPTRTLRVFPAAGLVDWREPWTGANAGRRVGDLVAPALDSLGR